MRLCEMADAERARLLEVPTGRSPWRRWGPYLAERAWGIFHGDTGAGLGASHQTGWTGLVASLTIARPS